MTPPPVERLRAWTYRRQRLDGSTADPADALRAVVGVYSSHPTAPLSLLARSPSFGARWLGEAEERREVVRLPAMRGSIHLLPVQTAPRVRAATRMPLEKFRGNLAYAKLSQDEYERLKLRASQLLREPMSPAQAQQAFGMDARLLTALRIMGHEDLVLRLGGSLRTDVLRYVWTEAWLGRTLENADPEESLRWLALEYLRAWGPARAKDFAWWVGIPVRRAAEALRDADVVDLGDGLLLRTEDRDAFDSVPPLGPGEVAVVPKWDMYTMGHAPDGRRRLVDEAHAPLAYSRAKTGGAGATSGDGNPLVLRGGRAVAAWAHRFTGDRLRVEVTPFEPGALDSIDLARPFEQIGHLLGAKSIDLEVRS